MILFGLKSLQRDITEKWNEQDEQTETLYAVGDHGTRRI